MFGRRPAAPPSDELQLRLARRPDVARLRPLWLQMMEEHSRLDPRFDVGADRIAEAAKHHLHLVESFDSAILVAEQGGELRGYITVERTARPPLYPPGRYGFISELCVDAAFRRTGIGRKLVDMAVAWCSRRNIQKIELLALAANPNSQAFWQRMGFNSFLVLMQREMTE